MITWKFFILLIFVTTYTFGQARFEKGYFINNDNRRTECFIKNNDQKESPVLLKYKLEIEASTWEQVGIEDVKEFGIYGSQRYIRRTVKIDRSSNRIDELTKNKNLDFEQKQLFLQVLVQGKASLYYYSNKGLDRFFYALSDTLATQLIYKKYLINNDIAYNRAFRQQLWTNVRCENTTLKDVENLNYTSKDLKKYFLNYNNSQGDSSLQIDNQPKVSLYNLKVTPGINFSTLQLYKPMYQNTNKVDFNSNIFFRIGIESAFLFPYRRRKWEFLFEPSFQYFNAQNNVTIVKFNSLEIPIGLRHFSNLDKGFKLYVNGLAIPGFALDFNQEINGNKTKTLINQGFSYALGAGIEKNRFSIEIRHYTKRKILFSFENMSAEYNRTSVTLGYKLIQSKK